MAGERRALLVATDAYTDPGLTRLRAPVGDVRALAEVLGDQSIGGFDVRQLTNRGTDEIKQEVEGFFDDARLQDLLLLYVSGHGVLSKTRRLYFATVSTTLKRLRATAIEDGFVHDVIQHSRARSIVLVLDCCHSGAFAKGLVPKGALGVGVEQRFGFEGRGRITLTASTELEYAFEEAETQASISELGTPLAGSLFTRYVVEGLQTGDADVNRDGRVSIDELYDYVYARVRERSPHQTPGWSGVRHGDIVIARSLRTALPTEGSHDALVRNDSQITARVERARIDVEILRCRDSPLAGVRLGAVEELERLLTASDPALVLAARQTLEGMVDDDSRAVTARVAQALGGRLVSDAYKLGPGNATLRVMTGRSGAAAKAGHDLVIEVTSWEATLAVGDAPSLELSADPTSLHVIEAKGGFQALDDGGKVEIRKSIDKDILKKREILFRSSRIQSSEGMLKLSGDLKLGGTTKPISFQLHEKNGTLTGAVTLRPSNWGIKPYSALFGALKVNDEVTVSVEARLNATTRAG